MKSFIKVLLPSLQWFGCIGLLLDMYAGKPFAFAFFLAVVIFWFLEKYE